MKFKGFLVVILTLLLSVYSAVDTTAKFLDYKFSKVSKTKQETLNIESIQPSNATVIIEETSQKETKMEEEIPVSASGSAKGKLIKEFLSPYKAGDSYNNIYLKNSSGASIDLKSLYEAPLSFNIEKSDSPEVLIVHTHTTESYIMHSEDYYTENDYSRTTDSSKNLIAIGNIFEQTLKNNGISVIHDTTIHDHPSYTGSYSRSAKTISSALATYKNIKIVIDIHRDAISSGEDKIKPIKEINGKNAAQVMLVMGSETGSVTNHANWLENLKFATKYQQKMEEMYPGLARAMMLNSSKYNQNLSVGSILIEIGSEGNSFEEAKYAAVLASNALTKLLDELK